MQPFLITDLALYIHLPILTSISLFERAKISNHYLYGAYIVNDAFHSNVALMIMPGIFCFSFACHLLLASTFARFRKFLRCSNFKATRDHLNCTIFNWSSHCDCIRGHIINIFLKKKLPIFSPIFTLFW